MPDYCKKSRQAQTTKSIAAISRRRLAASTSCIAKAVFVLAAFAVPQGAIAAGGGGAARVTTEGKEWPTLPKPSKDAPNILLIMTDDVGFAATSTFGGPVSTPNYDRLAKDGARYNGFNTTAICSPTRASLLTGREPHNVNMGNVLNVATGFRGYTSVIPKEAGSVAEVLKAAGYATAAFGKWHQTPEWEMSTFGPFDRWPTGSGFDYFYGFNAADSDQFAPALYRNTTPIAPPTNDPDYILDKDLADEVIGYIHRTKAVAPDNPFFVYLAPGTAHSPHSAPADWIAKFRGQYDMGWDELRKQIFARQKKLGVIPADAKLTPRPDFLPAWASLNAEQKKVYARMMEIYAGCLAYNDAQVGRILDDLDRTGQRDNTLIIFIQGDNGASAEGGLNGLHSEEAMINGVGESFEYIRAHLDELGGPKAHNHYPAMWAWALTTPFQYYKQVASHAGGTRNGLVINWRGRIKDPGQVRQQFLHVSDIMPTILEAAKIPVPAELNGVKQMPLDGISFASTFSAPKAQGARRTQVFEVMQNLGIYHDGWFAGTKPEAAPWEIITKSLNVDVAQRKWELYNLGKDFSQSNDLAKAMPAKLDEMKQLFFSEAQKYHILPIHGISEGAGGTPSLGANRTVFRYLEPVNRIPENSAPKTLARSFDITADIVVPEGGAKGVLVTQGGRFGGYSLYLKDGVPVFHYNAVAENQFVIRGNQAIPAGQHKLVARFTIDKPVRASGGTLTLLLDGVKVGEGRVERTYASWISTYEGFDVGEDTLTPISDDYTIAESTFTGKINELLIELK